MTATPAGAPPPSPDAPSALPGRRNRGWLLGAFGLLSLLAATAVAWFAYRQTDSLGGAVLVLFCALLPIPVVVGSFLSPLVRRRLSVRTVLLLELWAGLGVATFLVWPSVYVLFAGMLPAAVAIPSTDSVVHGYRIAMTPDRLLGRAEAVRTMISLSVAPLGPLVAGLLLALSARATVAVFAAAALVLAVWGAASPSIRDAPDLDALDELVPVPR